MRNVYDFEDDGDLIAAAVALAAIKKSEGWNVLRQRAEVLRQEAAAQVLEEGANAAAIRGRIEGVFKLLEDAEVLIARGQQAADGAKKRASDRGSVFEAGGGNH